MITINVSFKHNPEKFEFIEIDLDTARTVYRKLKAALINNSLVELEADNGCKLTIRGEEILSIEYLTLGGE